MELKYAVILYIGIIIALGFVVLCIFYKSKKNNDDAVKLANTELLFEKQFYKKQKMIYYALRAALVLSLVAMIISTAVLLARPYYIKKIKEQKYNRDIILCLDISSSVDELNLKLCKDLQNVVRNLSGERIGIVIFNTTPVVLSPLTDDYEYTIEQLENIVTAIKSQKSSVSFKGDKWLYWNEYLYGGTLVGNELRGSSLIGDGLLGGLFAFPKEDNGRTKIMIFATDNDPNGEGFVTLPEAAEYCAKNDVTVYGIGTKLMYSKDKVEMEAAVRATGGKFYLEEKASTFHEIVDEIEAKSATLTEGKTIIKLIESPEKYYVILIISFIIFVILSLVLRRATTTWTLGAVTMGALLILTYIFAIRPANQFSMGPDLNVKRKSNLNVLFVIDDTISMLANDMQLGGTRLDKAKVDLGKIVEELEGAQYSVISFNNQAMLLAPFSSDIYHVKNSINSLYPLERLYAKGSSLDTPKELMLSLLKSIKEDPNQKTAVFFVSDGEITAENATLGSFAELKPYIDGGYVLGYGTKEGGTMTIRDAYSDEDTTIEDYSDWPTKPAVSVIDENNLKAIAKDLGVEYKNMNGAGDLGTGLLSLKAQITVKDEPVKEENNKDEYINPPAYYGFYALVPFAILILLNAMYVIKEK